VVIFGTIAGYYIGFSAERELDASSTLTKEDGRAKTWDLAPMNLQAAWADLRDVVVGKEGGMELEKRLVTDQEEIRGIVGIGRDGKVPFCVVRPESTREVAGVMKVSHARKIPVTVMYDDRRGDERDRTFNKGVCVDLSRMRGIHEDDNGRMVYVGAGSTLDEINSALRQKNECIGVEGNEQCSIGNIITLPQSGRDPSISSSVIGLTAVLADGTIIKTDSVQSGSNIQNVLIGSGSSFGIITEISLATSPSPQNSSIVSCTFDSPTSACIAAMALDLSHIRSIELLKQQTSPMDATVSSTLAIKLSGSSSDFKSQISQTQTILKKANGLQKLTVIPNHNGHTLHQHVDTPVIANPTQPLYKTSIRAHIPLRQLEGIIKATQSDFKESGLSGEISGRLDLGCLNTTLTYQDREKSLFREVEARFKKRVNDVGGKIEGSEMFDSNDAAGDMLRKVSLFHRL